MPSNSTRPPAALVTAGSKRIGRAISLRLARRGYDLAVHYFHSREEAEDLRSQVMHLGIACKLFQADFNDTADTAALVDQVYQELPNLELVVNSASVFNLVDFLKSDENDIDTNINVHLRAPYLLTREFAKTVKKGHIINLVDASCVRHDTVFFAYQLTKKALVELTLMSARRLAPDIRVNAIAPGLVLPPEGKIGIDFDERMQKNPLKRRGEPDDVVAALDYLITAKHVTGQILFVDGGEHIDF